MFGTPRHIPKGRCNVGGTDHSQQQQAIETTNVGSLLQIVADVQKRWRSSMNS